MNGTRLAAFIGVAGLLTAGCDGQLSTGTSAVGEKPRDVTIIWDPSQWDPIDCSVLPDTSGDIAQTPRARPDLELLALHFSPGIVAQHSIYERLVADIAAIAALEPEAPTDYRAPHDGRQLLIIASPRTLEQMASGSYDAWNCLNEHYDAQSFRDRRHFGVLRLKGTYELTRLADLYARLPGIAGAEPDWLIGDGSTVYVTRVGEDWHYVADAASGDCPAGCIDHVLYYFISEPGGAVRYMDRWSAAPDQDGPSWVETYWRRAETRQAAGLIRSRATAWFDREAARGEAEALLGLPESELQPGPNLRIVRRGEEWFPVTLDLRLGRLNVELDDDGSGRYVVTRVGVEVPEGIMLVE